MTWTLSQRAQKLTSSAIREILKVTERPEVISFAGGLPSAATFPVEHIRKACDSILTTAPSPALQYGPTEGYKPLREWVVQRHSREGAPIDIDQVLITTGSQQALDLLGKVLIDVDSRVLVETPTYLGALQSFSLSEPEFVSVPSDDQGPIIAAMTRDLTDGGRFMYCLPNFQNPTGRRMPVQRRKELIDVAAKAGLPLVEDDPYGSLSYRGEQLPSLWSMNPGGVVHMGSFSKVFAPGLRVGYVIAPEKLALKLVQAKQAADLHTPSFTQRIVHEVIKDGFLDDHIPQIRQLYASQCRAMLDALQQHFPKGCSWNEPEGGMFIWVRLPQHIDTMQLLDKAIAEEKIAFVPGAPFFANDPQHNTMRLSFVTVPKEKIEDGIARLGKLIARECAQ
ncbi:PLP-dependent aminotransferase family protein [Povalibacter sp.]|uniref:aminotransferase-like domain-containing protein n=1 Tax=Povalibacter sp. TaxID=1962978 RepID=UPI002F3F9528